MQPQIRGDLTLERRHVLSGQRRLGQADLMVRHNVGVVTRSSIDIKAVDEGFFVE